MMRNAPVKREKYHHQENFSFEPNSPLLLKERGGGEVVKRGGGEVAKLTPFFFMIARIFQQQEFETSRLEMKK